jgi:hypothetical protein
MLWKSLHRFNIMLYMAHTFIPPPRERDQVIMEIIFSNNLAFSKVKSISRCRGALKTIFLTKIMTVDGKYLEHFIFDPGG